MKIAKCKETIRYADEGESKCLQEMQQAKDAGSAVQCNAVQVLNTY